jgi:adenylate cyclase
VVMAARSGSAILLAVASACVLLAEAMAAVALARNWQLTWWEWHLLMLVAFGAIAFSASREDSAERFRDLYLDQTAAGKREVSVLFADLAGFTSFSEEHQPTEVIAMLNEYWESAVPIIDRAAGAIEHFAGDGVLVLFNALAEQPDHASRAVRCALDLVHAADRIAETRPRWPRFRAGVNTGPAAVGIVGAAGRRSVATIGDTTNLGSRLMSVGAPGQVVISGPTRAAISAEVDAGAMETVALGPLTLKGKRDPVPGWVVRYPSSAR